MSIAGSYDLALANPPEPRTYHCEACGDDSPDCYDVGNWWSDGRRRERRIETRLCVTCLRTDILDWVQRAKPEQFENEIGPWEIRDPVTE